MSNKIQTDKNIDLTYKFIQYFLKAKNTPVLPKNVSFVPFSATDTALNKANQELIDALKQESKPVAKVEEPKTQKGIWTITPVNFSI